MPVKVLKLAWKELKLTKSQRTALALILMYPVVVIFALAVGFGGPAVFGALFGETGMETVNVIIYLPEDTPYFDSDKFWMRIESTENIVLFRADSHEKVMEGLRYGTAKVGILVTAPEAEGEPLAVDLYYDNSSLLAAKSISEETHFAINRAGYIEAQEILSSIWHDLGRIQANLNTERDKTVQLIAELNRAETTVADLQDRIAVIDMDKMLEQLDDFDQYYDDTKEQIRVAQVDRADAQRSLTGYRSKLVSARDELEGYNNELKGLRNELVWVHSQTPEPLATQLAVQIAELEDKIVKIDSTVDDIDSAIVDIDSANIKLTEIGNNLEIADSRLDKANTAVQGFKTTLGEFKQTLDEIKKLTADALAAIDSTNNRLGATLQMLDDLIVMLEGFSRYKPSYLVNPVQVEEKALFEVSDLALMTPLSISLVMLLTCMLLTASSVIIERKQGIYMRLWVSPTTESEWALGKVLGQMVFALIEAGIILIIALAAFGVPLPQSPLDLLAVLLAVSFSFVALGMFITNFTSTQSTAILGTLLIIIPMLFLSGMLFPVEFMPYLIGVASSVLPLTIANNLLMGVMIKGVPLELLANDLAYLIVPAIVLLAATVYSNRVVMPLKRRVGTRIGRLRKRKG